MKELGEETEGPDLANFDKKKYKAAVEKLKAESDTASTKAQTAGSTTKTIEDQFGIPGKITKWGMGMLGKTSDQRKAELAARDLVIDALGLREDEQPDMIERSGADEANTSGRRRAVKKVITEAADAATSKANGKGRNGRNAHA